MKNYKKIINFFERLTCSKGLPGQHRDILQHGVQPKLKPAMIETTHKTELNYLMWGKN